MTKSTFLLRITSRRGIALITVMMAVSVSLMLLGAFLQANRGYLRLAQGGRDRDTAQIAAQNAYEFCRFQLEHDSEWGRYFPGESGTLKDLANGNPYRYGEMVVEEMPYNSADKGARVHGSTTGGATFDVVIQNNMEGKTADSRGVPPHSCRFLIRSNVGDSGKYDADALVRGAAYFDSTIVAAQGVDVTADYVTLASRDPINNQIRSKSDMDLPELKDDGDNLRYQFVPAANGNNAIKGTVWAEGDIQLGGPGPGDDLTEAAEETGGRFLEFGKTHYEIPRLDLEDIDIRGPVKPQIPAGQYAFEKVRLTYHDTSTDTDVPMDQEVTVLTRSTTSVGSPPNLQTFFFMNEDMEALVGPNFTDVRITGQPSVSGQGKDPVGSGSFPLDPANPVMTANLSTRTLFIDSSAEVEVQGDFSVRGFTDSAGGTPATVKFGPPPPPDPDDPPDPGAPPVPPLRGSLKVDGNLDLDSEVVGSGNLLASGDITLRPRVLETDAGTDDDLAIFAGRDVLVQSATWSNAVGDTWIKGLVYAQRDFNFQARSGAGWNAQRLYVEGAVVAHDGRVNIQNAQQLLLTYDTAYLDDILKKSESNRAQVELVSWRPR